MLRSKTSDISGPLSLINRIVRLQLSILQTCYEILSNSNIRNSEQHQFVISFLTKLVRHLFEKLKTSPMLFVDLLFWKSKQDCHCITANYAIHGLKKFSGGGGKSISKEAFVQDRRALLNSLGDDDDDDDDMGNDENLPGVETLFRSIDRFVTFFLSCATTSFQHQRYHL